MIGVVPLSTSLYSVSGTVRVWPRLVRAVWGAIREGWARCTLPGASCPHPRPHAYTAAEGRCLFRSTVFLWFEIIINVLVSSFRFIWLHMLWIYASSKYFTLSVRGSSEYDVIFACLKSITALEGLTLQSWWWFFFYSHLGNYKWKMLQICETYMMTWFIPLNSSNFQSLEIVDRGSETEL